MVFKKGEPPWNKGKTGYLSEESRDKLSKANLGNKKALGYKATEESRKRNSERPKPMGTGHPNWRGDDVGYHQVHKWVREHMPKPEGNICPMCEMAAKRMELHNIPYPKTYRRIASPNEWIYLCRRCHSIFENCLKRAVIEIEVL